MKRQDLDERFSFPKSTISLKRFSLCNSHTYYLSVSLSLSLSLSLIELSIYSIFLASYIFNKKHQIYANQFFIKYHNYLRIRELLNFLLLLKVHKSLHCVWIELVYTKEQNLLIKEIIYLVLPLLKKYWYLIHSLDYSAHLNEL